VKRAGNRAPPFPLPTIDPGVVPGALDEPPLISADMHPPVDLAEDLERFNARLATYLKPEDITRVGAAYVFANAAHRGQMRISGAPTSPIRWPWRKPWPAGISTRTR
jgi:hypothetical protein